MPAYDALDHLVGELIERIKAAMPLDAVLLALHGADGSAWNLKEVGYIFSIAIAFLGISAALFGAWLEKAGPRRAMFYAAICFSLGFIIASFGASSHQLWLIYLGYGVIGGMGLGLGYISPVSTLIKWFPDKRGMIMMD